MKTPDSQPAPRDDNDPDDWFQSQERPADNANTHIDEPSDTAESEHDDARRMRAGETAGRVGVQSRLAEFAGSFTKRDIDKHMAYTYETLYGMKSKAKVSEGEPAKQDYITDPLTGRRIKDEKSGEFKKKELLPNKPIVPITRKVSINFNPNILPAQSTPENPSHPLLIAIDRYIKAGDFTLAIAAQNRLETNLAGYAKASLPWEKRIFDKMSTNDATKSEVVKRYYRMMCGTVYDTVMSVPDDQLPVQAEAASQADKIVDEDSWVYQGNGVANRTDRHTESSDVNSENDPRTWDAELNLYNIQSLRSHILKPWTDTVDGKDGKKTTRVNPVAITSLNAGGFVDLYPAAVARYLNVDVKDLTDQIKRGGTPVVPRSVITKLNFFLSYAENNMPEAGISDKLADFNNSLPSDTSPVSRMVVSDEQFEAEVEEMVRNKASFLTGKTSQRSQNLQHNRSLGNDIDSGDESQTDDEEPKAITASHDSIPHATKNSGETVSKLADLNLENEILKRLAAKNPDGTQKITTFTIESLAGLISRLNKLDKQVESEARKNKQNLSRPEVEKAARDRAMPLARKHYDILLQKGIITPKTVTTTNGEENFYAVTKTPEELEEFRQQNERETKGTPPDADDPQQGS